MRQIINILLVLGVVTHSSIGSAQAVEPEEQEELAQATQTLPSGNISREPLHRGSPNRELFQPQQLPFLPTERQPSTIAPGVTVITPSAYGLSWGTIGVGIGIQERARFTSQSDAVAGVGIGFGNSVENVGFQLGIVSTDVSDTPFDDGVIDVKLHRQFPEQDLAVAIGAQALATWGPTDAGFSPYGVITKRFPLKEDVSEPLSEIYVSAGIGGGQFRSEADVINDVNSIGVFGSVAVRVVEPVSAIAEWTGQDLTLGLSVVPFQNVPLIISPALTDITGNAGDGTRFIIGIGYGISF